MPASEVNVQFSPALRRLTGGVKSVTVHAGTVRELVEELERRFPGMRSRLSENDRLRPGIGVVINSAFSSNGLAASIPPGAEVQFLPSIAGG